MGGDSGGSGGNKKKNTDAKEKESAGDYKGMPIVTTIPPFMGNNQQMMASQLEAGFGAPIQYGSQKPDGLPYFPSPTPGELPPELSGLPYFPSNPLPDGITPQPTMPQPMPDSPPGYPVDGPPTFPGNPGLPPELSGLYGKKHGSVTPSPTPGPETPPIQDVVPGENPLPIDDGPIMPSPNPTPSPTGPIDFMSMLGSMYRPTQTVGLFEPLTETKKALANGGYDLKGYSTGLIGLDRVLGLGGAGAAVKKKSGHSTNNDRLTDEEKAKAIEEAIKNGELKPI